MPYIWDRTEAKYISSSIGNALVGVLIMITFAGNQLPDHQPLGHDSNKLRALAIEARSADKVCTLYFDGGVMLHDIPVAETLAQQAKGLSGRDSVEQGMLFRWAQPNQSVFWMRDTHVSLSIGFFDETGVLYKIEDMKADTDTYHYSERPATDALELPLGKFAVLGLHVGSRLVRRECAKIGKIQDRGQSKNCLYAIV